jgi:hypothetical protein
MRSVKQSTGFTNPVDFPAGLESSGIHESRIQLPNPAKPPNGTSLAFYVLKNKPGFCLLKPSF